MGCNIVRVYVLTNGFRADIEALWRRNSFLAEWMSDTEASYGTIHKNLFFDLSIQFISVTNVFVEFDGHPSI
jgi:hypothetical protein